MKKLLIIATILLVSSSCSEEEVKNKNFLYVPVMYYVPDSLLEVKKKYVVDLVTATNNHLTAGDYEHPEKVLSRADEIAERQHGVLVDGIEFWNGSFFISIPEPKLSKKQRLIYLELKANKQ